MRNDEVVAIICLCMHNIAIDYYHLLHKRRIRQINVSRRQANRLSENFDTYKLRPDSHKFEALSMTARTFH